MERLAIVMPVYNEEAAIGAVLDKWVAAMDRLGIEYQIHPYNDGSKDNSWDVIRAKAEEHAGKVVAHTKPNGGHGPTILQGYREAAEAGYNWVFQIDSDDEMGPEGFGELWNRREEYDFLVGIRDGRKQALPRKIISAFSRLSVRLFYGKSIWDVNTPYRLMRVSAFKDVWNAIPRNTFAPNVIITGMAASKKLRCYETRVPQHDRTTGEVSIKKWKLLKAALRAFGQTIVFSLKSRLINLCKYSHIESRETKQRKRHSEKTIHKPICHIRQTLYFIIRHRFFLFLTLILWAVISGYFLLNLPHSEISIIFSNTTPSKKCDVKTAPCTWHFIYGQCAYKTSFDGNEQRKKGTPLWINDLWIIPSEIGKPVEVKSIIIDGDNFSASYLRDNTVNYKFSNNDDFITITQNTRFKINDLSRNSSLNKNIISILIISLFCALAASSLWTCIHKKISRLKTWNNIVPSAISLIILLFMLYWAFRDCWQVHHLVNGDTLANLDNTMHYVCLGKWRFDPFITAGLAYLYPLSIIISCYQEFSPTNIMNAIVLWNFIIFLIPCIVILTDLRWRASEKFFLAAGLTFAFFTIPNPYRNLGSINTLFGEFAASCVFIAAVIVLFRYKNLYSLVLSGFLFAAATQIKQVFIIHAVVIAACCLFVAISWHLPFKKVFLYSSALLSGFFLAKMAGVAFEINTFKSLDLYKQYLNGCSIYNYEGAIQIHLWDKEFLIRMWRDNLEMFAKEFGHALGIGVIVCGVWATKCIITPTRYYKKQMLPIMLFISSFCYLIFWIATSSVNWRVRHLNGVFFVFLAGLLFLLFNLIRKHMTPWKDTGIICIILIFFLFPNKKYYSQQNNEVTKSYEAIYPILKQYHHQNALVFVNGLRQIYFRGRDESLSINSNFRKMIDGTKVVVWCRSHEQKTTPSVLKDFAKQELYHDGLFVVEKFIPSQKTKQ